MQPYRKYKPTGFDSPGLALEDQQDWLVVDVVRTRDSGPLAESNFACTVRSMKEAYAAEPSAASTSEEDGRPDYEVHRFGHWGPGWFEIVIVRPGSACEKEAAEIEAALADYPIVDESDYSEREQEEANRVWSQYRQSDRIDYMRKHRSQMEFHDFSDMMACARGRYFSGYASEIVGDNGT